MTFIARMLRYLFWVIVISGCVAILRRIVEKMGSGASAKPYVDVPTDAVNQKLVRDPVCGMHLAPGLALPLKQGAETLYFCSAECRDKYENGRQKLSASA
jgi:YHS domain-containing protein